ncbi:Rib/alpha-like domain-containing protein, partial [Trueperella sp. LYQ141]|uniref:Rib/alpha-like domain-containing protein n=1 Tax=Trueperella sp. LYQ141 TaxID=3391058 RepID=UPI0039837915
TPKSDTPGDQDVTIKVTYPDKSTETVTGKITVTDAAPTKPVVDPIKAGDDKVKVGEPLVGDTVVVTLPDGSEVVVTKDPTTGKWTTGTGTEVPVKDGKLEIPVDPAKTTEGGEVTVVTKKGDSVSEETKVTIGKPDVKPTKPVVDPIKAGDDKVKVGEPLVGDTVVVTLPDGSEVVVTKDPTTGKWTTGTGTEVPVKDGKLQIPVDPAKTTEGGAVSVIVKKGDSVSDIVKVLIGKAVPAAGTVVETRGPVKGGILAHTGASVMTLGLTALAMLLLGGLAVLRRRDA